MVGYGEITPLFTAAIQDISTILGLENASTTCTALTVADNDDITIGTTTNPIKLITYGVV